MITIKVRTVINFEKRKGVVGRVGRWQNSIF